MQHDNWPCGYVICWGASVAFNSTSDHDCYHDDGGDCHRDARHNGDNVPSESQVSILPRSRMVTSSVGTICLRACMDMQFHNMVCAATYS